MEEAKKHFRDGLLDSDSLVFRGLFLSTLELCLAFFAPFTKANSLDKEFGPGIYVTSNIEVAKNHARSNGAIMVFQKPDERDLTVWKPNRDEWNRLTASWLRIPLQNVTMPAEYRTADIIVGPTRPESKKKISKTE